MTVIRRKNRGKNLRMAAVSLAIAAPGIASAGPDYTALGQKAYAGWRCAILVEFLPEHHHETIGFYEVGNELMREFVGDWMQGKFTQEDVPDLPLALMWNLTSTGTLDFRLGFLWAMMLSETIEELTVISEFNDIDDSPTGEKLPLFSEDSKASTRLAEVEYEKTGCAALN